MEGLGLISSVGASAPAFFTMPKPDKAKKVVFCTPTITKPYPQFLAAMEASITLIKAAGWDEASAYEVGCPYISHARATLTRRALDAGADVIVYLDHDLSWEPGALLRLIETEDDCVAGTYRFKKDVVEYMATIDCHADGRPRVRNDGLIYADKVPAGFLKITKAGVQKFMRAYPELLFGDPDRYTVDLFNHGAHQGVWFGEDYAFSRRWRDKCGEIMLIPDLQIDHHTSEKAYPGHFHNFMTQQPGGSQCQSAPIQN